MATVKENDFRSDGWVEIARRSTRSWSARSSRRIVHLVPTLAAGGAERLLADLTKFCPGDHAIVSLTADRPAFDFAASLTFAGKYGRTGTLPRVRAILSELKPDIVHSWLYHGNIASIASLGRGCRRVWSVHNTDLSLRGSSWSSLACQRAGAWMSGLLPDAIVYCGPSAARYHEKIGYDARKSAVIVNGRDLSSYRADAATRSRVRTELGVPEGTFLIGSIARYHPQKNHAGLIRASKPLLADGQARLVLAGQGCSIDNAELMDVLAREGVAASTILLGHRSDTGALLNALDVLAIASVFGEAYPIVAIEASATGTAIVATDVGDTAEFVCGARYLVPPGDTPAMTLALTRMRSDLHTPVFRAKLADKARETASRNSIEVCAASYDRLYGALLQ